MKLLRPLLACTLALAITAGERETAKPASAQPTH